MVGKASTDWDTIEREYRSGQMSIAGICKTYFISRTSLDAYATKYGWERDMASGVKSATHEEILRRTIEGGEVPATDTEFTQKVAERTADVVIGHRTDIVQLKNLAKTQMEKLAQLINAGSYEPGEVDTATLLLALSKGDGTIAALNRLTDVFAKVIAMERQAYGLDDQDAPVDPENVRKNLQAIKEELTRRGVSIPGARRASAGNLETRGNA